VLSIVHGRGIAQLIQGGRVLKQKIVALILELCGFLCVAKPFAKPNTHLANQSRLVSSAGIVPCALVTHVGGNVAGQKN
jgi:hypothetical protein